jgi:hypothetical protein
MTITGHLHKIEAWHDGKVAGVEVFRDGSVVHSVDVVDGSATRMAMKLMRHYEPDTAA